ncbi:hydroxypyruvate isomerase [Bacillus mesophilus]|uniref:DUF3921 domain-containing protein n=1 Tax=Bacillus mesophilus TaxID=1808955 RepID=A0A6M0Q428_9BACI|nr:DUF3921 family protein [Bacillus mesophilus]MBM7661345.1 hydroxypyruvate isomerase [Bacillus mesophilus]NEY71137.1 DUF3921 domain-containing protein [Bacillus mesophilus]
MLCDPLDFSKIKKAIDDTNKLIDTDLHHLDSVNGAIMEANEHLMNAISHATSIDKKYLKYTNG